ncbi:MAG: LON peptidase substrate-binding domain-containing protein [Actinomycetota bacterium]|nr:LON peptidase substrate-binding domain-containing protein [Actinomycetota bacterium]
MAHVEESFPLFPLGIVLLPTEIVPLHIFEERYKLMIGRCVEEESEFGIVWLGDEGLKEVGCTARVAQVLERMDDGRMNILAQGGRPFRLLRRIEDLPYPAGDVEMLDDLDEGDEALAVTAREAYADLVERVTDKRPGMDELDGLTAYGMAATIELAAAPKQALLEERSEDSRLKTVGDLFSTALQRIDSAEEAQERAKSNGKVRF